MAALSDFLENAILQSVFNGVAFVEPSTWVSLHDADPTDAGGNEISGFAYARVRVYAQAGGSPDWNTAVVDGIGYLVDNEEEIAFPTASGGSWGTVTHFGIYNAATVGDLLFHGVLTASKTVGDGDTFKFPIGDLNLRLE